MPPLEFSSSVHRAEADCISGSELAELKPPSTRIIRASTIARISTRSADYLLRRLRSFCGGDCGSAEPGEQGFALVRPRYVASESLSRLTARSKFRSGQRRKSAKFHGSVLLFCVSNRRESLDLLRTGPKLSQHWFPSFRRLHGWPPVDIPPPKSESVACPRGPAIQLSVPALYPSRPVPIGANTEIRFFAISALPGNTI